MNIYMVTANNKRSWTVAASNIGTAIRRALMGEKENREDYIEIECFMIHKNMSWDEYKENKEIKHE